MIIWLASYPRSGNTFLRVVIHAVYGVPTYSVYDDNDPVAQRVGPALVGYADKPASRDQMAASPEIYFVKTHKRRKAAQDRAIYLVRDGRDAVVSYAHQRAETSPPEEAHAVDRFDRLLRAEITRPFLPDQPSSGTWGGNVLSWLDAAAAPPSVLRFEDLIADPRRAVEALVAGLVPALRPISEARIPSFAELHGIDSGFFRRGQVGSHVEEMSAELQALFWAQSENAEAMRRLGYGAPRSSRA